MEQCVSWKEKSFTLYEKPIGALPNISKGTDKLVKAYGKSPASKVIMKWWWWASSTAFVSRKRSSSFYPEWPIRYSQGVVIPCDSCGSQWLYCLLCKHNLTSKPNRTEGLLKQNGICSSYLYTLFVLSSPEAWWKYPSIIGRILLSSSFLMRWTSWTNSWAELCLADRLPDLTRLFMMVSIRDTIELSGFVGSFSCP